MFSLGPYTSHSGKTLFYKIECDDLTNGDIETLARLICTKVPNFGSVEGVPRGGLRLANELRKYVTTGKVLIVDDVLTTGSSIEECRNGRDAMGAVIFARGPCPNWVTPLFKEM